GDLFRRPAAGGRGVVDHLRARHRDRGPARPRSGDLPRRLGTRRRAGRPRHGRAGTPAGHRRRLPGRGRGLQPDRAGDSDRLHGAGHPRLRADRRRERNRPAHPHRRGRHVPARATGARDLLRPLRLGVRSDPRARGLRSAVRRPGAGGGRPHRPLAGRRRHQPRRLRPRPARVSRSPAHRRAARQLTTRVRADGGRAAGRDPAAPRRAPGDAHRLRELRRDGLGDEPERLRGRRAPPPLPGRRVPHHRRARPGHVRPGAGDRPVDRLHRPARRAGGRVDRHGHLDHRAVVARVGAGHRRPALPARRRLEPVVRRGDRAARRPDQSGRARTGPGLQRPPLGAAGRHAGAARRIRAGVDRRRRAGHRRHPHRGGAAALAAAGVASSGGRRARGL
ncbi:MAG: hypothetical protein AVDCRST_MAG69-638, partial [uncultured Solirubrobacteraceae bacterium]